MLISSAQEVQTPSSWCGILVKDCHDLPSVQGFLVLQNPLATTIPWVVSRSHSGTSGSMQGLQID